VTRPKSYHLKKAPNTMTHNVPNRNWSYPTAIKFGVGRIAELADHCKARASPKPLLVTDKALASLPITADALAVLEVLVWAGGLFRRRPEPERGNMAAGIAVYKAGGHDGVICFGGGSALDLGKMIALMAHQRADLSVWDLEDIDDWFTRADASRSRRSSPCRPPQARGPKWAAPGC
jgi:alcohol dehydrogenase class IV